MLLRYLFPQEKPRIYLDYAAATPLLPAAKAAMEPYLESAFGNPSAIHAEGAQARTAVEQGREQIARAIQCKSEQVTFTGSGTEANNLAIIGTVMQLNENGRAFSDMEVITTRIEHPSVMKTMESLKRRGVVVKYVRVNEVGQIDVKELAGLLSKKTVLCSCALVNSEIGTIQNTHAIKKALAVAEEKFDTKILLHLDAAQAPLWMSCQFDSLKADLVTFDAGKCNGPKGVGMLVRSRRVELVPHLIGGGQEDGLRAGTENVAGIVGAGVAFAAAQEGWRERTELVRAVRDEGITLFQEKLPEAILNGPKGEERVANNINISLPGIDTEFAVVVLDKHGIAASTKSACSGAGGGESAVVKAICGDAARATATIRLTLGPENTIEDLKKVAEVLRAHINKMKDIDSR